jgi:hypothetical protein
VNMGEEPEISRDAAAVLRVLWRYKGRPASGDDVMERIFATTSEVPMDPDKVSRAVKELTAIGFTTCVTAGRPDPGFDFVTVTITAKGEQYLTG